MLFHHSLPLFADNFLLCFLQLSSLYGIYPNPNLKQLPFNLLRIVLKAIAIQKKKSFAKLLFIFLQLLRFCIIHLTAWGKEKFFCLLCELCWQFKKLIFGDTERNSWGTICWMRSAEELL